MPEASAVDLPRKTTASPVGLTRRRALLVVLAFLVLNLVWRAVRYALRPPFWGDETMLAASLLSRDYGGLLRPLMWAQLAPPGFLWVSEAISRLLGFGEWSLRLGPAAAGTAATALFAWMVLRYLRKREAVLAACILAASYFPMRHSLEFKPYSTDLLMGVVIMFLGLEVAFRPTRWKWRLLAVVGVAAPWLSFPSVLVFGGVTAWLFFTALPKRIIGRLSWLAIVVPLGLLSFGLLYVTIADWRTQHTADYRAMSMWANSFPPWDRPWMIPVWLVEIHAGRMLSYPNGGKNFGSTGTLLLCVLGGARLYRSSRRPLLWLLLAPLGMGLLAAAVGKYPYGGSMRTMLYAAPSVVILMAVGVWCGLTLVLGRRWSRTGFAVVLALLTLLPLLGMVQDVRRPHRLDSDLDTRNVMRQLAAESEPGEVWVWVRTRPSVSGVAGEYQLVSGQAASALQFYGDVLSPAEKRFTATPAEVAAMPTERRLILLDHGPVKTTQPPSDPVEPYLQELAAVRGAPVVAVHPLGPTAALVTYTFEPVR